MNANSLRIVSAVNSSLIVLVITFIFAWQHADAGVGKNYITYDKKQGAFTVSQAGKPCVLVGSRQDYQGVLRVLGHLQNDISSVTGGEMNTVFDSLPAEKEFIIAGTIGKNGFIDDLIKRKKIDVKDISGKWETYLIQVVQKPFPKVDKALVIAGSDKRGTIYGIFDLAEKSGVSPWYWWADVPIKKSSDLYVLPGRYTAGEPKVKYRGIFINDEAPALSGWSLEKYGTEKFNHKLYERAFELILRLKGNFLWPAMWGRAFYDDDPENPKLADEYGVVIGTSHHEPMMRAHDEWRRYGKGPWNYDKNDIVLRDFWKKGIERMGNYESIVTLAMRGDGDEPMSDDANISLLQKIVKDQREILSSTTGREIEKIPQVWALYKEVQDYYDMGMRVPDDVTLTLCDDNWGNIRKLPKLDDKHKGGYGIYYHFDYVGAPRNYKWLNTNQIERTWEQLRLAYEYGAKKIWIVNVGDIKPMEFPISFFMDYAWNPESIKSENLPEYYQNWAATQFGAKHAGEIARILEQYTKYNSRRKPELLSPETYNLTNYDEFERTASEYMALSLKGAKLAEDMPSEYTDAFFELVQYPVIACANLYNLYLSAAKNNLYYKQGRILTDSIASMAKKLFALDAGLSTMYNNKIAGGKWKHMMDQTHIGYTYWQQPDSNSLPPLKHLTLADTISAGLAIEGKADWYPEKTSGLSLPVYDCYNRQVYYLELFSRGKKPFEYEITCTSPWVQFRSAKGKILTEKRVNVMIDWHNVPAGYNSAQLTVKISDGSLINVQVIVDNNTISDKLPANCFVEKDGYVSIEAEHFTKCNNAGSIKWEVIPNLGRTGSGMTSIPVTASSTPPGKNSASLEYSFYSSLDTNVTAYMYLSPTMNFHAVGTQKEKAANGLRFAVSLNTEKPQIINIHQKDIVADWRNGEDWMKSVSENIRITSSVHHIKKGLNTLKFWRVDPGIVIQKIVIDCGGLKETYLGPPESYRIKK